jgi:hypothetical protein
MQISENVGAIEREHRADQTARSTLSHRGEPPNSRTAKHPHQQGLGLIVAMMRERDIVGADSIGGTIQKQVASIASPLFEIRRASIEAISALDVKLDTEPRAHRTHEGLVAIGLIRANPMVQMSGGDTQIEALAQIEESMGKRDGISASGEADKDPGAPANRETLERSHDRVDHGIS